MNKKVLLISLIIEMVICVIGIVSSLYSGNIPAAMWAIATLIAFLALNSTVKSFNKVDGLLNEARLFIVDQQETMKSLKEHNTKLLEETLKLRTELAQKNDQHDQDIE